MTEVIAEQRRQSTITRSASLTPDGCTPRPLLSGFAEHLRARNPAEDVVLAIRRDGSMIGMEVRHATGRGEVVASALADYGLIVTGASEAGPAKRRMLDAAGPPSGMGGRRTPAPRWPGSSASSSPTRDAGPGGGAMAVQAQDAGVREALDALGKGWRGFGAGGGRGASAPCRARRGGLALVARIGEVAELSEAARRRAARALDRGAARRRLTVRRGGRAGRRPPGGDGVEEPTRREIEEGEAEGGVLEVELAHHIDGDLEDVARLEAGDGPGARPPGATSPSSPRLARPARRSSSATRRRPESTTAIRSAGWPLAKTAPAGASRRRVP